MALDLRPYFGSQVPAGAGGGPRYGVQDTSAGVMAGALAQIAQATDLLAEEEATRTADVAVNDAVKAQSDFQESLRGRQDYQAFTSDYQSFWQGYKAKTLAGLSGRARRKAEGRLTYMEAQGYNQVRGLAWAKQTDVGRAQLVTQTDQAFEVIGRDPFGETGRQAFDGLADLYRNAASTGLISQEQAAEALQGLDQRLGVTQVAALIEANPYDAKKRLGAGEFDALLQPEKKAQLVNAAESAIKQREAEARARAAADNALYLDGFEDEIAFVRSGQSVADTAYTRDELVRRFGDKGGKLADEYERAQAFGADYAELAGASPAEAAAIFAERGEDMATPENFRAEAAELSTLQEAWQARNKALDADPAGFAIRHDPAAAEAHAGLTEVLNNPGAVDPGNIEEAAKTYVTVVGASIERMTGEPAKALLPGATASAVVKAYQGAGSAEEQIAVVAALTTGLGDEQAAQAIWPQLRDAGIPEGFDRALEAWERGDRGGAIRIATALSGEEVKLDKEPKKEISAALAATYDEGVGQVLATQAAWLGQPDAWAKAQSDRSLIGRVASLDLAAGGNAATAIDRATKDVTGGARFLLEPDLAAVVLPAGAETSDVERGLERLRENIGQRLTLEDMRQIVPGEGSVAEKERALFLEDLAEDGRWVNHGAGFALAMPAEGGMALVTRADGSVVSVSLDEVVAAAGRKTVGAHVGRGPGIVYTKGAPQ